MDGIKDNDTTLRDVLSNPNNASVQGQDKQTLELSCWGDLSGVHTGADMYAHGKGVECMHAKPTESKTFVTWEADFKAISLCVSDKAGRNSWQ